MRGNIDTSAYAYSFSRSTNGTTGAFQISDGACARGEGPGRVGRGALRGRPGSIFFFQAEDGIRDRNVTGVQTCALPIFLPGGEHPVRLRLPALGRRLSQFG